MNVLRRTAVCDYHHTAVICIQRHRHRRRPPVHILRKILAVGVLCDGGVCVRVFTA